jgi:hypothetical protein
MHTTADALSQPHDDSALKAALAAERERCANEIMKYAHNAAGLGPEDYAELVRRSGD